MKVTSVEATYILWRVMIFLIWSGMQLQSAGGYLKYIESKKDK